SYDIYEEVFLLLDKYDEDYANRIHFKSSFDFVKKINQYIVFIENNYFEPIILEIGSIVIPLYFIIDRFKAYSRFPLLKRFSEITKDIAEKARFSHKYKLNKDEKRQVKESVFKMFKIVSVYDLYKDFYDWLGDPKLFTSSSKSLLEWSDVFPLIYF